MRGPNPYVFVVGCPRSGTTLVKRMLDHHPHVAMTEDAHLIPRDIVDRSANVDPPLTREAVDRVRHHRRFYRMRLNDSAVDRAAAGARTYGEFVSRMFDEVAAARGKPLAGHKRPDYVRHLAVLDSLFPSARFVHIVRDGRDVTLSVLDWARPDRGPGRYALWNEEPVGVSALWWRRMVEKGRRTGEALGPGRYLEVRYEDVVKRPRETLGEMLAFLDLPFSEEALEYHRGKTREEAALDAKRAWLPPTPGLRDWRTQMRPRDIELFENLAGDLLGDLGYERSVENVSPEAAAAADRCRAWWDAER